MLYLLLIEEKKKKKQKGETAKGLFSPGQTYPISCALPGLSSC
jgi:hypothetical protein